MLLGLMSFLAVAGVSSAAFTGGSIPLYLSHNVTSGPWSIQFQDLANVGNYTNAPAAIAVYYNGVMTNETALSVGQTSAFNVSGHLLYIYLNSSSAGPQPYEQYIKINPWYPTNSTVYVGQNMTAGPWTVQLQDLAQVSNGINAPAAFALYYKGQQTNESTVTPGTTAEFDSPTTPVQSSAYIQLNSTFSGLYAYQKWAKMNVWYLPPTVTYTFVENGLPSNFNTAFNVTLNGQVSSMITAFANYIVISAVPTSNAVSYAFQSAVSNGTTYYASSPSLSSGPYGPVITATYAPAVVTTTIPQQPTSCISVTCTVYVGHNMTSGPWTVQLQDLAQGTNALDVPAAIGVYYNGQLTNLSTISVGNVTRFDVNGNLLYVYDSATFSGLYAYQKWANLSVGYITSAPASGYLTTGQFKQVLGGSAYSYNVVSGIYSNPGNDYFATSLLDYYHIGFSGGTSVFASTSNAQAYENIILTNQSQQFYNNIAGTNFGGQYNALVTSGNVSGVTYTLDTANDEPYNPEMQYGLIARLGSKIALVGINSNIHGAPINSSALIAAVAADLSGNLPPARNITTSLTESGLPIGSNFTLTLAGANESKTASLLVSATRKTITFVTDGSYTSLSPAPVFYNGTEYLADSVSWDLGTNSVISYIPVITGTISQLPTMVNGYPSIKLTSTWTDLAKSVIPFLNTSPFTWELLYGQSKSCVNDLKVYTSIPEVASSFNYTITAPNTPTYYCYKVTDTNGFYGESPTVLVNGIKLVTTTFMEAGLPTGANFTVTFDGQTKSISVRPGVTGSTIYFSTISTANGGYTIYNVVYKGQTYDATLIQKGLVVPGSTAIVLYNPVRTTPPRPTTTTTTSSTTTTTIRPTTTVPPKQPPHR